MLSVFSPELLTADRKAYCAMLAHLRDHDPHHTVVLIQVENVTGLLGDSRDRSAPAELAWHSEIPPTGVEEPGPAVYRPASRRSMASAPRGCDCCGPP